MLFILYLNSNFSAATVFTEDICSDAFKDFAERSAAKKHGQLDLVASEMFQRRYVFQRQRCGAATDTASASPHCSVD